MSRTSRASSASAGVAPWTRDREPGVVADLERVRAVRGGELEPEQDRAVLGFRGGRAPDRRRPPIEHLAVGREQYRGRSRRAGVAARAAVAQELCPVSAVRERERIAGAARRAGELAALAVTQGSALAPRTPPR